MKLEDLRRTYDPPRPRPLTEEEHRMPPQTRPLGFVVIPQLPMGELRILLDAMELVCEIAAEQGCSNESMTYDCSPRTDGYCADCWQFKARRIAAALEAE